MNASKKQIGYLIGLAKKCGTIYEMDDFINEHDQIMISSSEANQMIKNFKKELGEDDPCDTMRRKLVSMARTIGWVVVIGREHKANMEKINAWCMKYGQYHKPLNDHSYDELVHLVTQFQYGPMKSNLNA